MRDPSRTIEHIERALTHNLDAPQPVRRSPSGRPRKRAYVARPRRQATRRNCGRTSIAAQQMNVVPQIQSLGHPPEKHADMVVAEMLHWLIAERERRWRH